MGSEWPPPAEPGGASEGTISTATNVVSILATATSGELRQIGGLRIVGEGIAADRVIEAIASRLPPCVVVPSQADIEAIAGGTDWIAVLTSGRHGRTAGLVERAAGGCIVVRNAELMEPDVASSLRRTIHDVEARPFLVSTISSFEKAHGGLASSPGMTIDMRGLSLRDLHAFDEAIARSPARVSRASFEPIECEDTLLDAAARALERCGRSDSHALLAALTIARVMARMDDASTVAPGHMLRSVRMVAGLADAPRNEQPTEPEQQPTEPEQPSSETASSTGENRNSAASEGNDANAEREIEEIALELPSDLLASMSRPTNRTGRAKAAPGGAGRANVASPRGRLRGTMHRPETPQARPSFVATVRAALSARPQLTGGAGRLSIRPSDIRYQRRRSTRGTTVFFGVDASGSSAAERLAEAKGAVASLLARAYVRRDKVALVAFRGARAELAMAPTRGLVAARRTLSAIPGGGGTPLASALHLLGREAANARRREERPLIVLLTDGRGNVALDGRTGRAAAREDETATARAWQQLELDTLVIDVATRPTRHAQRLAAELGARHIVLPRSAGAALADTIDRQIQARDLS